MAFASRAVLPNGRRVLVLTFTAVARHPRHERLTFGLAGGEEGLAIELFSFGTTTGLTVVCGPSGVDALAQIAAALDLTVPAPPEGSARASVALRVTKGAVSAADRAILEGFVTWDLGAPLVPRRLAIRVEPEPKRLMLQEPEPGALDDFVRLAAGALPETARQRAYRLNDAKDLENAKIAAKEALALDPKDAQAKLLLARILDKLDDADGAIGLFSELIAAGGSAGSVSPALAGRAACLEKRGRLDEAIADLTAKIDGGDASRDPRIWRGRLHLAMGRPAEALADLDAGLAVPGFSADVAHRLRAEALEALGRAAEAAEARSRSAENASAFSAIFDSFGARGPRK